VEIGYHKSKDRLVCLEFIPSLLHVSHEARNEGLKNWTLVESTTGNLVQPFYISLTNDTLCLNWWAESTINSFLTCVGIEQLKGLRFLAVNDALTAGESGRNLSGISNLKNLEEIICISEKGRCRNAWWSGFSCCRGNGGRRIGGEAVTNRYWRGAQRGAIEAAFAEKNVDGDWEEDSSGRVLVSWRELVDVE